MRDILLFAFHKSLFIIFLQVILNSLTCFLLAIVLTCTTLTLEDPSHVFSPGTQIGKHGRNKNSTIQTNFTLISLWSQVSTQDCWPGLISSLPSKQLFLHPHLLLFLNSFSPDDFYFKHRLEVRCHTERNSVWNSVFIHVNLWTYLPLKLSDLLPSPDSDKSFCTSSKKPGLVNLN